MNLIIKGKCAYCNMFLNKKNYSTKVSLETFNYVTFAECSANEIAVTNSMREISQTYTSGVYLCDNNLCIQDKTTVIYIYCGISPIT